jgi:sulfur-carrier protein
LRIAFLLWGPMRRVAGRPRVEIDLPEETSLAVALDSFYETCQDLLPHRATSRAVVGVDYAEPGTILHDGDEISLIPPVQGG